ncbi:MAG: sigma-54 dependent transcriptional regulator [Proteobacteria bacterium]|nr:sigma-54 dependent transcriptional regulator [Pseudomonadota bacterium]MBU1737121.1 sigma-54 dependent transcriptional regulator [Pseudomonadota bacterium]
MAKVLIIEDSEDIRLVLSDLVRKEGYTPFAAGSGEEGLQILGSQVIDLVFLDIGLPDANGIELLTPIHETAPDVDVVMLTGMNDARSAVNSLKGGAVDYIIKPFELLEFRHILTRLIAGRLSFKQAALHARETNKTDNMLGNSPGMVRLRAEIETAARVKAPVLITGETGTGKELVARAIYRQSQSGEGVFVKIDCGTLSPAIMESELFGHEKGAFTDARESRKGLVEMADGGTLFLDEIGNLPLDLQPKLLRLIEESTFRKVGGAKDIQVNVRIIAATNVSIAEEIRTGRFRDDLYYRLNVLNIQIPPLRDRGDDVLLLAAIFLDTFSREMKKKIRGFTPDAEKEIRDHDWPGNVRELKNHIERGVIYCNGDRLHSTGLKKKMPTSQDEERLTLQEMETLHIRKVLQATGNNKSQAARILDISRTTLREKLNR